MAIFLRPYVGVAAVIPPRGGDGLPAPAFEMPAVPTLSHVRGQAPAAERKLTLDRRAAYLPFLHERIWGADPIIERLPPRQLGHHGRLRVQPLVLRCSRWLLKRQHAYQCRHTPVQTGPPGLSSCTSAIAAMSPGRNQTPARWSKPTVTCESVLSSALVLSVTCPTLTGRTGNLAMRLISRTSSCRKFAHDDQNIGG